MKLLGTAPWRGLLLGGAGLLLVLCLGGCGRKEPIDDKTMEQMLYEMYIAQSIVGRIDSLRVRQRDSALEIYEPIVARYGHTMEEFDSMLSLYAVDPARLDAILDRLVARVEEEKATLMASDSAHGGPERRDQEVDQMLQ